jgi:hypothetical protein
VRVVAADSDWVASMGGAVAAALWPDTVKGNWFAVVSAINEDKLLEVATSLAARRRRESLKYGN